MLRRTITWRGPPLALQILGLLLGGLVVAQLVTLLLTLLLPPAPKAQYGMDDVAAMLAGHADGSNALRRTVQAAPPQITGPGWLGSEKSRTELAHLAGADPADVMLAFYTPLPFAGTIVQRNYTMADDGMVPASYADIAQPAALILAQYQPSARHHAGGFPGGAGSPHSDGSDGQPGPDWRSGQNWQQQGQDGQQGQNWQAGQNGQNRSSFANPWTGQSPNGGERFDGGSGAHGRAGGRPLQPQGSVSDVPKHDRSYGDRPDSTASQAGGQHIYGPPRPFSARAQGAAVPIVRPLDVPPTFAIVPPASSANATDAPARSSTQSAAPPPPRREVATNSTPPGQASAIQVPAPDPTPPAPAPSRNMAKSADPSPTAPAVQFVGPPERRGLFGLAPAPFVEGDFVAALRLPDGRWAVVQPAPEPFPNSWQRRVLLWFALSLALVAPFGWLFARRLVKPLALFSAAAEQLGRDPSAVIGPLDGPAEIGRAAHAFNLMQNRLRSFVDDRTAMVGAISHDLRTPLTRMRFRIEDVPDDVRDGLLQEVEEMEAMITQVIEFIRDASTPGARERLDFRTLVDDVVDDARLIGSDVTIERMVAAPVEVDVLGMRRLLDNLLENAVKYGVRARIRLTTDDDSAVAEIIDDGPGLPDDEIERAFEPFYRSETARASDKAGSGLGLAVCRSIARAHGGDVRLFHAHDGFIAQIRVPLVFGAELVA